MNEESKSDSRTESLGHAPEEKPASLRIGEHGGGNTAAQAEDFRHSVRLKRFGWGRYSLGRETGQDRCKAERHRELIVVSSCWHA